MRKIPVGTALIGVLIGLFVAPFAGFGDDVAEYFYDRAFPVLEARADVIHKSPTEWTLTMYSKKSRDCRLLEVQAYDVSPSGEVMRLHFAREDGAQPRSMPPGTFRSANYKLSPPPKNRLQLAFMHECNGRTVRTPVPVS